jgi:predicted dehydrogenase
VSRIPVGIVGCGKIALDQHLPAIAAGADFEAVAVADPQVEHDTLPSFPAIGAMLEAHPEIAAVAICTPPRQRAMAARAAIAAGRHVLLEKPPCAVLAEAIELAELARRADVRLFTAWHSQEAAAVAAARAWLADRPNAPIHIAWKEDVRVWHPGQAWIWQDGGFGVFDPGINALSILTAIVPGAVRISSAELEIPANCATPIAARLTLQGRGTAPIRAEFDFRQTGPQTWDIDATAGRETMRLTHGGNRLELDGVAQTVACQAEYPRLYARFAALIRAGASAVDLAPLRLVEDALAKGRPVAVEPFVE